MARWAVLAHKASLPPHGADAIVVTKAILIGLQAHKCDRYARAARRTRRGSDLAFLFSKCRGGIRREAIRLPRSAVDRRATYKARSIHRARCASHARLFGHLGTRES